MESKSTSFIQSPTKDMTAKFDLLKSRTEDDLKKIEGNDPNNEGFKKIRRQYAHNLKILLRDDYTEKFKHNPDVVKLKNTIESTLVYPVEERYISIMDSYFPILRKTLGKWIAEINSYTIPCKNEVLSSLLFFGNEFLGMGITLPPTSSITTAEPSHDKSEEGHSGLDFKH